VSIALALTPERVDRPNVSIALALALLDVPIAKALAPERFSGLDACTSHALAFSKGFCKKG